MDMYKYCENIVKANNYDLFQTFSILPYEKSSALFTFYAFYKTVDNSIDEFQDISLLDSLEDKLKDMYKGLYVNDILFLAVKDSLKRFPSSIIHFQNIIKGVKYDHYHNFIRTEDELDDYCLNVSGSLQLLFAPILASNHYSKNRDLLDIISKNIGYAIQITNILRDVGDDIRLNRIYLTDEMLDKHGASPRDIVNEIITIEYINVIKDYSEKAKKSYQVFYDNIGLYDEDSQMPLMHLAKNYERILDKIVNNKYNNFSKTIKTSKLSMKLYLMKCKIKFKLKIFFKK